MQQNSAPGRTSRLSCTTDADVDRAARVAADAPARPRRRTPPGRRGGRAAARALLIRSGTCRAGRLPGVAGARRRVGAGAGRRARLVARCVGRRSSRPRCRTPRLRPCLRGGRRGRDRCTSCPTRAADARAASNCALPDVVGSDAVVRQRELHHVGEHGRRGGAAVLCWPARRARRSPRASGASAGA